MVVKLPNASLPTHLDLPETDGLPMDNDFQPTQAELLTSAIRPLLVQLHPNDDYFIGRDVGIYWKVTTPPLNGCKAPDWYYVPGTLPFPIDDYRRSYVMWQEGVPPLLVIEFVSGDGSVERDDTPGTGKFWVYRRGIQAKYYAIHDPNVKTLDVYKLDGVEYRLLEPNAANVVPIPEMGVALGHWAGRLGSHELTWVRFFTFDGKMLPSADERTDLALSRAAQAESRAAQAESLSAQVGLQMADLIAKLRSKGIDPNTL